MPKVHVLDDRTINQIAAGEVIDRPVSVVKELVENALDAGAHNISVEIRQGGLELIRASDDGQGMSEEDALLAIQRHATSKLKSIEDLGTITSLGFRGEALPSIVSVARVEIVTREASQPHGTKLMIEGNKLLRKEPAGANTGTDITVTNLFFNTPARKNFMRSTGYEGGLVHERMIQFSLSHPGVNFRLLSQGKEILNTTGINNLPDLLEYTYGQDIKGSLQKISGAVSQGKIEGYLTLPTYHRRQRKGIHFFINTRRVLSKQILQALEDAYQFTLSKGQFPVAVFHIRLAPSFLDVNIHPTKLEVKIRDPLFYKELYHLIIKTLETGVQAPLYTWPAKKDTQEDTKADTQEAAPPDKPYPSTDRPYAPADRSYETPATRPKSFLQDSFLPDSPQQNSRVQEAWPEFYTWDNHPPQETTIADPPPSAGGLPELTVIGQLNNTFILAEGRNGLYIIDQHIAHERIIFERLMKENGEGTVESQLIAPPIPLKLTLLEEELVIEHILPLTDLGITLEYFGPRSYLLRAVPACLDAAKDYQDFFYDLLHQLESKPQAVRKADLKKEVLILTSCKSAIKAGDKLSRQDMIRILAELRQTAQPLTCPHGRPILYQLPYSDLLKAFRRQ